MANNRLSAYAALAVLACCMAVSASAEVAIPDSVAESVSADSAASEPVSTPAPTAAPALSDSPLSADTRYSADEIAEILKEHPNAFTTASDPAAESSSTTTEDTQTEDTQQETNTADSGTIWLKPFNEYTPTEGYLLLLFVLTVSVLAFKLVRIVWL